MQPVGSFIGTSFLFCIASLLFSYSAIQPQVCNKTQCQCLYVGVFAFHTDLIVMYTKILSQWQKYDIVLVQRGAL